MTAERTIVTIEAEHIGKIELTPAQFAILLACASVGLDGFQGTDADEAIADEVWAIIEPLHAKA